MNTGKNIFHKANKNSKEQKRALVDIDETICFYSNERRYDLSEPNYKNIDKINKLYDEGWEIIYWTARGSVSGVDYREHTLKQLKEWRSKNLKKSNYRHYKKEERNMHLLWDVQIDFQKD